MELRSQLEKAFKEQLESAVADVREDEPYGKGEIIFEYLQTKFKRFALCVLLKKDKKEPPHFVFS